MESNYDQELKNLETIRKHLSESLAATDHQINEWKNAKVESETKKGLVDFCKLFYTAYLFKCSVAKDPRPWALRLFVENSSEYTEALDRLLHPLIRVGTYEVWRHGEEESGALSKTPYNPGYESTEGRLVAITIWASFEHIKSLLEATSFEGVRTNLNRVAAKLRKDADTMQNEGAELQIIDALEWDKTTE